MRRKTGAEGHKETNKVTQTQDEVQRRVKALAVCVKEGGGGVQAGKEQQKENRPEPWRNTEGWVGEPRRNTDGRGERNERKTKNRKERRRLRAI